MNLRGRDYWLIFVFTASATAGEQLCKKYYECPDKAYCSTDGVCKCNPGYNDESVFDDKLSCVKPMGKCDFNFECKSFGAYCNVEYCDCLYGYDRRYHSDGSLYCVLSSPPIHTSSSFVLISVIVPLIIVVVFVVSLSLAIYYILKRRRLASTTAYTSGWAVQPISVVPGTPAAAQSYSAMQSVQQGPQGGNNNQGYQK